MCPECQAIIERCDAATVKLSKLMGSLRGKYGTAEFIEIMEMASREQFACEAAKAELDRHRDTCHEAALSLPAKV